VLCIVIGLVNVKATKKSSGWRLSKEDFAGGFERSRSSWSVTTEATWSK
jgi:hypothetical protein